MGRPDNVLIKGLHTLCKDCGNWSLPIIEYFEEVEFHADTRLIKKRKFGKCPVCAPYKWLSEWMNKNSQRFNVKSSLIPSMVDLEPNAPKERMLADKELVAKFSRSRFKCTIPYPKGIRTCIKQEQPTN